MEEDIKVDIIKVTIGSWRDYGPNWFGFQDPEQGYIVETGDDAHEKLCARSEAYKKNWSL